MAPVAATEASPISVFASWIHGLGWDLRNYGAFDGALSGFDTVGTGDTIDVAGAWTWVGFAENSAHTSGLMTFADGAAQHNVTLMGDYAASDFAHQVVNGVTEVTYL